MSGLDNADEQHNSDSLVDFSLPHAVAQQFGHGYTTGALAYSNRTDTFSHIMHSAVRSYEVVSSFWHHILTKDLPHNKLTPYKEWNKEKDGGIDNRSVAELGSRILEVTQIRDEPPALNARFSSSFEPLEQESLAVISASKMMSYDESMVTLEALQDHFQDDAALKKFRSSFRNFDRNFVSETHDFALLRGFKNTPGISRQM
jgi:hypothetical protein